MATQNNALEIVKHTGGIEDIQNSMRSVKVDRGDSGEESQAVGCRNVSKTLTLCYI